MRSLDEDTITQAVIARHAAAPDARLREVMTSLVQHLHAFARDVHLSEPEWRAAIAFLDEAGAARGFAQLSDALGLSALVLAQSHRRPAGCTQASGAAHEPAVAPGPGTVHCELRGRVLDLAGEPVADAAVQLAADGPAARTDGAGRFTARTWLADPEAEAARAAARPAGRLLQRLGRTPRRALHLPVRIEARGYRALSTLLFRRDDPDLEHDSAFGVRAPLLADWSPDLLRPAPAWTLAFDFVLDRLPPNSTTAEETTR